jgi:predicted alpha/beta hydrolase family esterase
MVAVPDVHGVNFPETISDYQTPPLTRLPFPSVVLASTDDPYCEIDRAKYFAKTWGSKLISVGNLGHINTDSNLAEWPEDQSQLNSFVGSLGLVGYNTSFKITVDN